MKRATKRDPLVLVMQRARKNPRFFHELVFHPRKALSKVAFLDRASRARLLSIRLDTIIGSLVSDGAACENSCVSGTCGGGETCGGNSCLQTCIGSCKGTIITDKIKIDPARFVSIRSIPAVRQVRRVSRRTPSR